MCSLLFLCLKEDNVMINHISIQVLGDTWAAGYAVFLRQQKWEYIYFDVIKEKFPSVVVQRNKLLPKEEREQFERELLAAFFVYDLPLELGTIQVPAEINEHNRKVEMEMLNMEKKQVCLLVNLGSFELKTDKYLALAASYGTTVYSLTGDGLCDVKEGFRVPANVNRMTKPQLRVWSAMINEELRNMGFQLDQVVMLAAGKQYCGTIPLGMVIRDDIRIGA